MLSVGLTGGIGSGKSLVGRMFSLLDIPVLGSDEVARQLMETDIALKNNIISYFGADAYKNDRLNRSFLAQAVFGNPDRLALLNSLVHPATIRFGREWMQAQRSPYALKEAALFFESGSETEMDVMVGVSAPEALRLQRAMERDGSSEADVRARMARQMPEEEKMRRCDFIIYNDEKHSVIEQVMALHKVLLNRSAKA